MGYEFSALPQYALPSAYIYGLVPTYVSTTTMTISPGVCLDSTDTLNMSLTSQITLNAANIGFNGLDTGTLGASKMYYLYLIADSSGFNPTGAILSLSSEAPAMPAGLNGANYSLYRRIGSWTTDSSSHLKIMYQTGVNNERVYMYDTVPTILTGGTNTTFAAVSLSNLVPDFDKVPISLGLWFTPAAAGDYFQVRKSYSSSSVAAKGYGNVAGQVSSSFLLINSGALAVGPQIDYLVSAGSLTMNLLGYTDVV